MNVASRCVLRIHAVMTAATDRLLEERGAATAEYGMLLTAVALAAIGILLFFGGEILEMFSDAEDQLHTRQGVPDAD